jgi:hypothetical protein
VGLVGQGEGPGGAGVGRGGRYKVTRSHRKGEEQHRVVVGLRLRWEGVIGLGRG